MRIRGKITKVHPAGWGFIISREKPFTRIFFHWSGLRHTTKHFTELEKGMKVEFDCVDYINKENKSQGWRAFEIQVLDEDKANDEVSL